MTFAKIITYCWAAVMIWYAVDTGEWEAAFWVFVLPMAQLWFWMLAADGFGRKVGRLADSYHQTYHPDQPYPNPDYEPHHD